MKPFTLYLGSAMLAMAAVSPLRAAPPPDDGELGETDQQPVSGISLRTPGSQPPKNRGPQTIAIQDQDGKLLGRARYIWLTDQRVLVPVSAYEKLGMTVRRDMKRKQVRMEAPNSNRGFTFTVGDRTVQEPNFGGSNDTVIRYERPMLHLRNGEFYVAAMALKRYFGTLFDTRWDRETRKVTLQRGREMSRSLRVMPKD
ncbi:MAG: hypothetical protein KY468_07465 [Armatimonadetes bacterium]|nr:hypothetical protein [Armatimonadota bacterium]